MRGDFFPPSDLVPVGSRSSSHKESRKSSPSAKYKVVSSSCFPPVCGTGLLHSMPKPRNTKTITGSCCGVAPCSSFAPERCWREQTRDQDGRAASSRAGKQKHCHGGLSSTLNWAESLPRNFGTVQGHKVGTGLLPSLVVLPSAT